MPWGSGRWKRWWRGRSVEGEALGGSGRGRGGPGDGVDKDGGEGCRGEVVKEKGGSGATFPPCPLEQGLGVGGQGRVGGGCKVGQGVRGARGGAAGREKKREEGEARVS